MSSLKALTCNRAECMKAEAGVCSLWCVSCCWSWLSCIFTHGFNSVKAKHEGRALGAQAETGGSRRITNLQTNVHKNNRRLRKWQIHTVGVTDILGSTLFSRAAPPQSVRASISLLYSVFVFTYVNVAETTFTHNDSR